MCYVELIKLRLSDTASIVPAEWGNFQPGKHCPHSLPNGYTLTGFLLEYPKVGRHLKILRVCRNGVKIPGIYTSSTVTDINGDRLHTQNSVYQLRYIELSPRKLQSMLPLVTRLALHSSTFFPGQN